MRKRVNVSIMPQHLIALKQLAKERMTSVSFLVRQAVEQYLASADYDRGYDDGFVRAQETVRDWYETQPMEV